MTGREAIRAVAMMPFYEVRRHAVGNYCATMRRVCDWRINEPAAFLEIALLCGIYPTEDAVPSKETPKLLKGDVTREAERERIVQAIADCGGSQKAAAALLGMPKSTLQTRMRLLGIEGRGRGRMVGGTWRREHAPPPLTDDYGGLGGCLSSPMTAAPNSTVPPSTISPAASGTAVNKSPEMV